MWYSGSSLRFDRTRASHNTICIMTMPQCDRNLCFALLFWHEHETPIGASNEDNGGKLPAPPGRGPRRRAA